ncbi:hypothetical protein M979_2112 [Buttiauxella noackiae ATCC 51607]|uniref:Uncharacterized protein n=1 Tax=Buttiauxella noackiae ATCC 51607 TaxID=1354255 RepID=A0A1B7HPQ7_9ENTR|nr:hypothetical protein M979_2112 [Buttiauxella noackiae ATCC 51607]
MLYFRYRNLEVTHIFSPIQIEKVSSITLRSAQNLKASAFAEHNQEQRFNFSCRF